MKSYRTGYEYLLHNLAIGFHATLLQFKSLTQDGDSRLYTVCAEIKLSLENSEVFPILFSYS